jgi:hypothetical protein
MPTAVFVDAGFFLKRFPKVYFTKDGSDPGVVARTLHAMALDHLNQRDGADRRDLYRIFVYDCPPLSKKAQFPISGKPIDFSRSDIAQFRLQFHDELKCLRKVAVRLGRLQDMKSWRLKASSLRFSPRPIIKRARHVNERGGGRHSEQAFTTWSITSQIIVIVALAKQDQRRLRFW